MLQLVINKKLWGLSRREKQFFGERISTEVLEKVMLPTGVETELKLATCHSKVDVQETGIGGTERRFIQKTSNLEDGELAS